MNTANDGDRREPMISPSVRSNRNLSIAVVMPAHNEAAHVAEVLAGLPAFIDRIVVVDDASSDGTGAAVEAVADPRIHLITHKANQGVGGAMRSGYRFALAAGYDILVKMDADGQMRADELRRLVEPIQMGIADYTKGNRFYFSGATVDMPAHRAFGNTLLSFLTKAASGYWHVFDPQCGFTAIRAPFLRLIDLDALVSDYFFENDMLIKLNALGAYVVDVPISTLYGSEVSGVNIAKVAVTFPQRLIAAGARRFWRRHLVTDFGSVAVLTLAGLACGLFGVVFGGYHWWLSMASGRVATTGTVMVAVLPLIVGIQLLLQAFSMSVQASPGARESAQYVRLLIADNVLAADSARDASRSESQST